MVSLSGKLEDAYDAIVDELDGPRRIYLMTPHFLTVPMIIEENPQLIATVPRELAEAVQNADIVIEAVTEDLPLKQRLFGELDRLVDGPWASEARA